MNKFRNIFKWYWSTVKNTKRYTIPPLIMFPTAVILQQFVTPLFIGEIINRVVEGKTALTDYLYQFLAAYVLVFLVSEVLFRVSLYLANRSGAYNMRSLLSISYINIITKDSAFHANNFGGSLVAKTSRFARSFDSLENALLFNISTGLSAFVFAVIYLGITFPLVLAIFIISTIPFVYILSIFIKRRIPMSRERAALDSVVTGALSDGISNAGVVKAFANEDYEFKRFSKLLDKQTYHRLKTWDYSNTRVDLTTGFGTTFIKAGGVAGAVYAVVNGYAEVGSIYVAVTYISNLSNRMWQLNSYWRNIETALTDAEEMVEILDTQATVVDVEGAKTFKKGPGAVKFTNVNYNYSDAKQGVLLFKDLNLSIEPGQKIGLVGPSGGGKTTITKLLLRFDNVLNGKIEIDGQNTANVTQKSLRKNISYVPQESVLFHRTISENIAYAKPKSTQKEIEAAARKAHAHEFIKDLPKGYETLVGERGVKLSGGQRQRIAIARAILKDAPILLLDEATSALDSESEALIQDALKKLMEGRTSIVIAHRLSTIQHLDRIIVLEKGKVVEDGPHKILLKNKGVYSKLWSHQSGGFLE